MIRLTATTEKLQAVLGGAIATVQPKVIVCYSDETSTGYGGGKQISTLNSTTDVDICSAPAASTIRDIDYISIINLDTAAIILTVKYDISGTDSQIVKATLDAGDHLIYTHSDGWSAMKSDGSSKGGGGGSGTVTSVAVSGGTTGLTTSGGPITTTGTITIAGTLAEANGGTGLTSLGTGVATFLGTPSSANLAAAVTGETGSGALVFATSPTLVTPALGTPASGVLTNCTGLPLTAGVTGVLPKANGGVGTVTAFSATSSTAQSIPASTFTKIQFNTEAFDVNGDYDNATNYRWTPTVAGKMQVQAWLQMQLTTTNALFIVAIYKNGSVYKQAYNNAGFANQQVTVGISDVIDMNGSTDYLEVFCYQGDPLATAIGANTLSVFSGFRVAGT